MAGTYEITNFDTHMPIKCTVQTLGFAPSHKHEYFEIDMVLEGRCEFTVDGRPYTLNAEDVIAPNRFLTQQDMFIMAWVFSLHRLITTSA